MGAGPTDDPVIDEVREVRRRISERCGHDPGQLVAYYQGLQGQFRDRLLESALPALSPSFPAAEPACCQEAIRDAQLGSNG